MQKPPRAGPSLCGAGTAALTSPAPLSPSEQLHRRGVLTARQPEQLLFPTESETGSRPLRRLEVTGRHPPRARAT